MALTCDHTHNLGTSDNTQQLSYPTRAKMDFIAYYLLRKLILLLTIPII